MSRHKQWEQRLVDLVAEMHDHPHEWGKHDCLLWSAAVVKAVTGKDHGRGHRGKYNSHIGAYRYLNRIGFASPEAMIDSHLEEKPVGFAQRGDLVLAADGIPAVCMGGFALSVGEEGNRLGLVKIPRSDWVKAWRVG